MANELATSKDITNYLKHVFDLEKMLYQQNEILEHLRDSIGSVNYQMKLEPEIYQEKRPSVVGGIITAIACAFFAILVYFGYVFLKSPEGGAPGWFLNIMLGIIGIFVCFVVGGIILVVSNVVQTQSYNQQVRITNQENIEEIQRYRKNLLEKGKTLNDEYALLADERKKTKAVLNKFYSTNVIYPKYRSLPAIASLFEYMLSERCYGLTGHEGAYNLYENELRLGHIISTLDSISSDIKEIKQNQRMLYDVMSESQKMTKSMFEQQVINGQVLCDIRKSNQIMQYNQNQIANRMEHMHWLEEQKYLWG